MDDTGKVHVSGYIEPNVLLKCLRKNGKTAHLVHWQYGECETNLYQNNSYQNSGYQGGGYQNGGYYQGGYGGYHNNNGNYYSYNHQPRLTYVPSYPPRGDPYASHEESSSWQKKLGQASEKELEEGEEEQGGNERRRSGEKKKTIRGKLCDLDEITLDEITGKLKAFEERIKLRKGGQVESQENLLFAHGETLWEKEGDLAKRGGKSEGWDLSKVRCYKCQKLGILGKIVEGNVNKLRNSRTFSIEEDENHHN
ncbi:hypothetical protein Tco_1403966 [Tanacetum coccineum]